MESMWCLYFFSLEKAYDTTWKYEIMRERLPLFIQNFLSKRIRVGTSLSDFYYQEMEVPQGSILSVKRALGEIPSSEQSSQSTAGSSRPSSRSSIASSRSSVASHQSHQADSRASSKF